MNKIFLHPVLVSFTKGSIVLERSQAEAMNFKFVEPIEENLTSDVEYDVLVAEKYLLVPFKVKAGNGDEVAQEVARLIQRRVIKRIGNRAIAIFD